MIPIQTRAIEQGKLLTCPEATHTESWHIPGPHLQHGPELKNFLSPSRL